ncbi:MULTISPECIES: TetR/AcrR family transcriptional regulator [Sphingobium]|jgi:AcrR family transcriptional regulator|uniref:TetR family transcriptional regulator n=1 Tax=Sphingobium baderi TaxID=1332080 RepID=A0A0S3F2G5_9SPHN|nr:MULTISPECIES: TetR/AcrR family transcriptional regulator [Sphingobium]ALR21852.1 TetR family transcriptional regulator [Sphingobium baderi]
MKLMPHTDWSEIVATDQSGSVQKIMDGTLRAISSMGTRRLSMSDISESSGVSRGTLYRYFASKEEVLAAVSEYICSSFEKGIVESGEGIADPIERFRAVMGFYGRFTIERSPEGIFEVEPAFHLNFLRCHFSRHKAAVQLALNPVLDYFEMLTGSRINRDVFCDTMVRLQLSTLIIPATPEWLAIWNSAPDRLCEWALQIAGHHAEHKKG